MRIGARAALSHGTDEHDIVISKKMLSQEDEIPLATVTTTGEEGDGTVGSTLKGRAEERNVLSVSLNPELRTICKENESQAATASEILSG